MNKYEIHEQSIVNEHTNPFHLVLGQNQSNSNSYLKMCYLNTLLLSYIC